MNATAPVLEVEDLRVYFKSTKAKKLFAPAQKFAAVDGVSFGVAPGEILGLVGESGCGKSTLARAVLRLTSAEARKVMLAGKDFFALEGRALREARRHMQIVFQDPYASLNPRFTVQDTLAEPLLAHGVRTPQEIQKELHDTLDKVALSKGVLNKYPHEFSGGQRQRIAIARALVLSPSLIFADEPVSSLDVSVQAQILNLLQKIRSELKLSMVFISHNLAVVRYLSDRVAVMYMGKIVEQATVKELYSNPLHPYTRALLAAVPTPDPKVYRGVQPVEIKGETPSKIDRKQGCSFAARCPLVHDRCKQETPELTGTSHKVACFATQPL